MTGGQTPNDVFSSLTCGQTPDDDVSSSLTCGQTPADFSSSLTSGGASDDVSSSLTGGQTPDDDVSSSLTGGQTPDDVSSSLTCSSSLTGGQTPDDVSSSLTGGQTPDDDVSSSLTGGLSQADAFLSTAAGLTPGGVFSSMAGGLTHADICQTMTDGLAQTDICPTMTGCLAQADNCPTLTGLQAQRDSSWIMTGGLAQADSCPVVTGGQVQADSCPTMTEFLAHIDNCPTMARCLAQTDVCPTMTGGSAQANGSLVSAVFPLSQTGDLAPSVTCSWTVDDVSVPATAGLADVAASSAVSGDLDPTDVILPGTGEGQRREVPTPPTTPTPTPVPAEGTGSPDPPPEAAEGADTTTIADSQKSFPEAPAGIPRTTEEFLQRLWLCMSAFEANEKPAKRTRAVNAVIKGVPQSQEQFQACLRLLARERQITYYPTQSPSVFEIIENPARGKDPQPDGCSSQSGQPRSSTPPPLPSSSMSNDDSGQTAGYTIVGVPETEAEVESCLRTLRLPNTRVTLSHTRQPYRIAKRSRTAPTEPREESSLQSRVAADTERFPLPKPPVGQQKNSDQQTGKNSDHPTATLPCPAEQTFDHSRDTKPEEAHLEETCDKSERTFHRTKDMETGLGCPREIRDSPEKMFHRAKDMETGLDRPREIRDNPEKTFIRTKDMETGLGCPREVRDTPEKTFDLLSKDMKSREELYTETREKPGKVFDHRKDMNIGVDHSVEIRDKPEKTLGYSEDIKTGADRSIETRGKPEKTRDHPKGVKTGAEHSMKIRENLEEEAHNSEEMKNGVFLSKLKLCKVPSSYPVLNPMAGFSLSLCGDAETWDPHDGHPEEAAEKRPKQTLKVLPVNAFPAAETLLQPSPVPKASKFNFTLVEVEPEKQQYLFPNARKKTKPASQPNDAGAQKATTPPRRPTPPDHPPPDHPPPDHPPPDHPQPDHPPPDHPPPDHPPPDYPPPDHPPPGHPPPEHPPSNHLPLDLPPTGKEMGMTAFTEGLQRLATLPPPARQPPLHTALPATIQANNVLDFSASDAGLKRLREAQPEVATSKPPSVGSSPKQALDFASLDAGRKRLRQSPPEVEAHSPPPTVGSTPKQAVEFAALDAELNRPNSIEPAVDSRVTKVSAGFPQPAKRYRPLNTVHGLQTIDEEAEPNEPSSCDEEAEPKEPSTCSLFNQSTKNSTSSADMHQDSLLDVLAISDHSSELYVHVEASGPQNSKVCGLTTRSKPVGGSRIPVPVTRAPQHQKDACHTTEPDASTRAKCVGYTGMPTDQKPESQHLKGINSTPQANLRSAYRSDIPDALDIPFSLYSSHILSVPEKASTTGTKVGRFTLTSLVKEAPAAAAQGTIGDSPATVKEFKQVTTAFVVENPASETLADAYNVLQAIENTQSLSIRSDSTPSLHAQALVFRHDACKTRQDASSTRSEVGRFSALTSAVKEIPADQIRDRICGTPTEVKPTTPVTSKELGSDGVVQSAACETPEDTCSVFHASQTPLPSWLQSDSTVSETRASLLPSEDCRDVSQEISATELVRKGLIVTAVMELSAPVTLKDAPCSSPSSSGTLSKSGRMSSSKPVPVIPGSKVPKGASTSQAGGLKPGRLPGTMVSTTSTPLESVGSCSVPKANPAIRSKAGPLNSVNVPETTSKTPNPNEACKTPRATQTTLSMPVSEKVKESKASKAAAATRLNIAAPNAKDGLAAPKCSAAIRSTTTCQQSKNACIATETVTTTRPTSVSQKAKDIFAAPKGNSATRSMLAVSHKPVESSCKTPKDTPATRSTSVPHKPKDTCLTLKDTPTVQVVPAVPHKPIDTSKAPKDILTTRTTLVSHKPTDTCKPPKDIPTVRSVPEIPHKLTETCKAPKDTLQTTRATSVSHKPFDTCKTQKTVRPTLVSHTAKETCAKVSKATPTNQAAPAILRKPTDTCKTPIFTPAARLVSVSLDSNDTCLTSRDSRTARSTSASLDSYDTCLTSRDYPTARPISASINPNDTCLIPKDSPTARLTSKSINPNDTRLTPKDSPTVRLTSAPFRPNDTYKDSPTARPISTSINPNDTCLTPKDSPTARLISTSINPNDTCLTPKDSPTARLKSAPLNPNDTCLTVKDTPAVRGTTQVSPAPQNTCATPEGTPTARATRTTAHEQQKGTNVTPRASSRVHLLVFVAFVWCVLLTSTAALCHEL